MATSEMDYMNIGMGGYQGNWTPRIRDNATVKETFTNAGEYYDIGGIIIATFRIVTSAAMTINSNLVIDGVPARDILGGNLYPYMASVSSTYHNIQPRGEASEVIIRPNITGEISSGTIIQGYIIGTTRHLLS